MAFEVFFEIKRNGSPVSGGVLVYEVTSPTQKGRRLESDVLDRNGQARTEWHSDWSGEDIQVYCHTDGIERGTPAYAGRVTLRPRTRHILSTR
jgi:hypothetical protein